MSRVSVWFPREWYVGLAFVPPVYPTLVLTTPEAHPKMASGNQNQDIPNVALIVIMVGSGRGPAADANFAPIPNRFEGLKYLNISLFT